jgi:peptidoglycan/LPS O-acetylase OafA/YrhL
VKRDPRRPGTHPEKRSSSSWLRLSAVLTLLGLVLMVWAVVDPRATPVMIAMSVGQGLGTMAFVIYLGVVLADLRRARIFSDEEADQ